MFKLLFSFVCFSFVLSENLLFSIEDRPVYVSDFFQQISYNEWDSLDSLKRVSFMNSFVEKELSYHDAVSLGLDLFPENNKKLQERFRQLLINNTYEQLVAYPLISESSLLLSKKYLSEERLIYHVLVGFNGCKIPSSFSRTQEEAFAYALGLKKDLSLLLSAASPDSLLSVFSGFSLKFSEDPSIKTNLGLVGWVAWGRVVAAFQEAAFALNPLVLSSPVLTPYGYHLILTKEKRSSQYAFYNPLLFSDLSKKICLQALSFDSLKVASQRFDSALVSSSSLLINRPAVDSLVSIINEKTDSGKLRGNKGSYVSWLSSSLFKDVLFVFNNKGFGVGWFVNHLKQAPATRVPQIRSAEDLVVLLKSFIIQDSVFRLGLEQGFSSSAFFKYEFLNHKKTLLKNDYVSFLINSLTEADSLRVVSFYQKGLAGGNYVRPRGVVYSHIKTSKKENIDRAYDLFLSSSNFDAVLEDFGGRVEDPVFFGSGGPLASLAFEMSVGEVSPPVENTNKTFSIIRVEKFLEKSPLSLDHVYKQIQRKIKREDQDSIKQNLLVSLKDKYNIEGIIFP